MITDDAPGESVSSYDVALTQQSQSTCYRCAVRALVLLGLTACGSKSIDKEKAASLFTEVVVDTAPGLSGLAIDDTAGLWTAAERDAKAYRITLDDKLVPTIKEWPVEGIPDGTDLEGVAWLGKGRLAFGTEGREDGVALILIAEERGSKLQVTGTIKLPEVQLGLHVAKNHGTEGICGAGQTIIAAIEETGTEGGKRWAPIVRIDRGAITRVHKLWLTTGTGKISGLDCTIAADGSIQALAIERHFEVTKLLTFAVPASDGNITPTVALDLGPVLNGKLNLEGIAWTPYGVVAVIDNQYAGISGPSELLVFKKDAVK